MKRSSLDYYVPRATDNPTDRWRRSARSIVGLVWYAKDYLARQEYHVVYGHGAMLDVKKFVQIGATPRAIRLWVTHQRHLGTWREIKKLYVHSLMGYRFGFNLWVFPSR